MGSPEPRPGPRPVQTCSLGTPPLSGPVQTRLLCSRLAFDWKAFFLHLLHLPETLDSFLILQKPNIYDIYNTRASRSGSYLETGEAIRRWMRFGSEAPSLFWFQFRCERRLSEHPSQTPRKRDSVKKFQWNWNNNLNITVTTDGHDSRWCYTVEPLLRGH